MNNFGNILLVAMPGFYVLIYIEMFWAKWRHNEQHRL